MLHITAAEEINNSNNSGSSSSDQQLYPTFGNVGFNRLTNLQLTGAGDTTGQLAVATASMIQRCSTLESVKLCFPGSPVPDRFFTSLVDQTFIRVVHFEDIDFPTTGPAQLFTELAIRNKTNTTSALEIIGIERCRGVTSKMLCALTDIVTLSCIRLGFNSSSISVTFHLLYVNYELYHV